jgi:hypothetical protein
MAVTYLSTRSVFLDSQCRNESAAISALVRDLARWQNTTYARDLKITPTDSKVRGEHAWTFGNGDSELIFTPNRSSATGVPTAICQIYLPDPRGPFRTVRMRFYCQLASSSVTGSVLVRNADTGIESILDVDYASLGDATEGWATLDVDGAAFQTLQVRVASPEWKDDFKIQSVCGYWLPPTIAGATNEAWRHVATGVIDSADRPDSSYALRWLARMSNAHWRDRPLQVCASWLDGFGSGTSSDWLNFSRVVGRYAVWVGARVSSLTVLLGIHVPSSASVTVSLSGPGITTSSATWTPAEAGWAFTSQSIEVDGLLGAGGECELTITVDGDPSWCEVTEVHVQESDSALGLVGGLSVPGDFLAVDDADVEPRSAIRNSLMLQLCTNMLWLWTWRRARCLISDDRYTAPMATVTEGSLGYLAIHHIQPSRGFSAALSTTFPFFIRNGYYKANWTFDPDALSGEMQTTTNADERAWAPILGPVRSEGPFGQSFTWAAHHVSQWQHRQSDAYDNDGSFKQFSSVQIATPGLGITQGWTILEELPLGVPMLIGAP